MVRVDDAEGMDAAMGSVRRKRVAGNRLDGYACRQMAASPESVTAPNDVFHGQMDSSQTAQLPPLWDWPSLRLEYPRNLPFP
mmetsp:Transcript_16725/g.34438  ORF Transcript_16725/g.34438 Transcript_16725/m.34438 type:complete len:82 (-) Transcript_16725:350-595(-)